MHVAFFFPPLVVEWILQWQTQVWGKVWASWVAGYPVRDGRSHRGNDGHKGNFEGNSDALLMDLAIWKLELIMESLIEITAGELNAPSFSPSEYLEKQRPWSIFCPMNLDKVVIFFVLVTAIYYADVWAWDFRLAFERLVG